MMELDGVSDEWIKPVSVEKVAGGHASARPEHPGTLQADPLWLETVAYFC